MLVQSKALKEKLVTLNREDGFSLPELMVALLIFGVLTAIAVPIFLSQQNTVTSASLKDGLIAASVIVENEKAANNGVYPAYLPDEIKNTTAWSNYIYTYSDTQLAYCLQGEENGQKLYFGSQTNNVVSATSCVQTNVGGPQPNDDIPSNNTPPTNNNPSITTINPATQYSRTAGATVTITGSHFLTGATVIFDGVAIPAVVTDSNTLTFVNPGNDVYEAVSVQVKNPNARTSGTSSFEFINPILTHTAATPTAVTTTSLTATQVTVTAAAITCPYSATPQYSFMLTQKGSATSTTGIAWTDSTGRDVTAWSTQRTFTSIAANQGWPYATKVMARCELEGKYSILSSWSPVKTWTHPITTPAAPSAAPVASDTAPLINTNITLSWPAQTALCPAGTTTEYNIYDGTTLLGNQTTLSRTVAVGASAVTKSYTYAILCSTTWVDSTIGPKSPIRSVTVINKPNAPAAPTNLRTTSVAATTTSVAWNAVTCNIGTPTYRFVWVSPQTGSTAWAASLAATVNNGQGVTNTWRVEAKCTLSGVESDVTTSGNSSYASPVAPPTLSSGTTAVTNNGTLTVSTTATYVCGSGATVQYRAVKTREGNTYSTWNYAWSSAKSYTMDGLQGVPFAARMEVQCVVGSVTSTAVALGSTTWTRGIAAPAAPGYMVIDGLYTSPQTLYWNAVACPAGTWAAYYVTVADQNTWDNRQSGWTNATQWTRPLVNWYGWYYWAVQARCDSSWTSSGSSGQRAFYEPNTSG